MAAPNAARPNAAGRGYGHKWRKYREKYLARNPFCVFCRQDGRLTRATVVDHIKPHKGDHRLFWKPENHQALCATHHNSAKQSEEATGRTRGCDEHGVPLDAGHHWRT